MSNLNIKWKTSNLKITEPEQDEEDEQEFTGQDLEAVEKHARLIKQMLKSMGFKNRDDRNEIIERIKVLISSNEEDDPTDPWVDKDQQNDDSDWN